MKRYDMVSWDYEPGSTPSECDDGDWVKYAEAQAEIERLRDALRRIERHACENGQCMHSAPVAISMRRMAREALREQQPNANDQPPKVG
jgi:hypothetical protein